MLYNRNDTRAEPHLAASHRRRRRPPAGTLLYRACLILGLLVAASATAANLRQGSLELPPCLDSAARCGDLERPLDPSGAVKGSLQVHFEFYPHTAPGPSEGTLVATEGGPGYPATLSRDAYLALFEPLRSRRDVLIMDNRGTGRSGAVDCPALQRSDLTTSEQIGACGLQLGARAGLYSTALAADDLAAILEALALDRVDLYGDSYGTYFEQVFVRRHPGRIRSVVLDGAYPLDGPDYPWYPSYAPAVHDKFNTACARFAPCAALGDSSMARIGRLLDTLRTQSRGGNGLADPAHLAMVMFGSAPAYASLRDLDAAARAYADGDRLPLLRLINESIAGMDSRSADHAPAQWSAGLAVAVMCEDPPQIVDMALEPAARGLQLEQRLTARHASRPDTYAPFTIDEFSGMPPDYSFITQCATWPAHPPAQLVPPGSANPDVPVLVISGELDNMTTVDDGRAVAASFPQGRQVVIANSFHVNALPHARSGCGMQVVRQFLKRRGLSDPGPDTTCAAQVAPLRLTAAFSRLSTSLEPLQELPTNRADGTERQVAAAVVATLGDVLAHASGDPGDIGAGLRGGHFRQRTTPAALLLELHGVRWSEDVSVSGHVTRRRAAAAGAPAGLRDGVVTARVTITTPHAIKGSLQIRWREGDPSPVTASGTINGHVLLAQTTAP